jgi:hypothetical protein
MPATAKKTVPVSTHKPEKAAYAVLGVLEKAGKEITVLAREGRKRVRAYERRTAGAPKKARKT